MRTTNYQIRKMSLPLLVTDLERSVEFYTKLLGFTIDFRYEDFYTAIVKDGCSIHLKSGKPHLENVKRRSHEDLDILFSVTDIEGVYGQLLSKHVEIIQPLRDMPYGKEFYIADPDGYNIGFVMQR